MSYVYQLNMVINTEKQDVQIEEQIEKLIKKNMNEQLVEIVGSNVVDLDKNAGKCCECGAWTSDNRFRNYIDVFSNGARIKEEWFCDLCLPEWHENKF